MRRNLRWTGLALAVAAFSGFAACSEEEPKPPPSLCDGVDCGDNELVVCDEFDGQCKCGEAEQNLVCRDGEVCTAVGAGQYACESSTCVLVPCERGHTCNPTTGACVCGSAIDAEACADSQVCENGRCTPDSCTGVDCQLGMACEAGDGVCRCAGVICEEGQSCYEGACSDFDYCDLPETDPERPVCQPGEDCNGNRCSCAGGEPCAFNQRCNEGVCEPDACEGVNCSPGAICNPDDATCHCGTIDGPACTAGQACITETVGQQVIGRCEDNNPCKNVSCPNGMVCDPNPAPIGGNCRCGGIGVAFPICAEEQTCDLSGANPACRGGELCQGRDCSEFPGSSCDVEDGICKCGGLNGIACRRGEACAVEDDANICAAICNPMPGKKDCTGERSCYYDHGAKRALCLKEGEEEEDNLCDTSAECMRGLFCHKPSGGTGTCKVLCDYEAWSAGEPSGCEALEVPKKCNRFTPQPEGYPSLGYCDGLIDD